MKAKYGGWQALRENVPKSTTSKSWKSIKAMTEVIQKGVQWRLNYRDQISFWKDRWLSEEPLLSVATQALEQEPQDRRVMNYWRAGEGRDDTTYNHGY